MVLGSRCEDGQERGIVLIAVWRGGIIFQKSIVMSLQIVLMPDQVMAALDGKLSQIRVPIDPQPFIGEHGGLVFEFATLFSNGVVHTFNNHGEGGDNWNSSNHPEEDKFAEAIKRISHSNPCPYGVVGDRLKCDARCPKCDGAGTIQRNVAAPVVGAQCGKPCDFCDKCNAGRVSIEFKITGIRVEQIQSMSDTDAEKSGCDSLCYCGEFSESHRIGRSEHSFTPIEGFAISEFKNMWDKWQGRCHSWSENPWVWVLDVERVAQPTKQTSKS